MGLHDGGWCSCILYTVFYISVVNYVKCQISTSTVLPSPSPSIGNSVSTDSLNTTMSLNTDNVGSSSTVDIATGNSDVSVLNTQLTSSNIIAPTSSIGTTTASLVNDFSQDFTGALATSTTMPSSPSITPSQTLPATSSNAIGQDLSTSNQLNSTLTLATSENVNMPNTTTISLSSANSDTVVATTAVLSSAPVQTSNIAPTSASVGGSVGISIGGSQGGTVLTTALQPSHTSPEQSSAIMGSMSQSLTPSSTSTEMSSASSNETTITTDLSDTLFPSKTDALSSSSMTSTSATPSSASVFPSQTKLSSTSTIVSASTTTHISSIEPTTTVAATTSSSVNLPTAPKPSTTTQPPTTTIPQEVTETVDSNNVYKVETNFSVTNCTAFDTNEKLRNHIIRKNIPGIRDVVILKNGCKHSQRRRKRATTAKTVDARFLVKYDADHDLFIETVIGNFSDDGYMNLTDEKTFRSTANETLRDLCGTDVCDQYVGYVCDVIPEKSDLVKCFSRCKDKTCSGNGYCKVVVDDGQHFVTQCVCETKGYYKYEGDKCENREMTWELAVAIAGGTAGGIILILIFALALCGCCKCKDDQYKYRRDSYEQMYERSNKPAYYRNDGPKTHQTGFNNFGYDDDLRGDREMSTNGTTWNPDDSKDTYEKIGRMSQQLGPESSFQIKRPQIAGSRQSSLNEATNEGEDGLLEMSHRL